MALDIPTLSTINAIGAPEVLALATTFLLDVTSGDAEALRQMCRSVRWCLDPTQDEQDLVDLQDALDLCANLMIDISDVDPMEEEPLVFITLIVDFYALNLP